MGVLADPPYRVSDGEGDRPRERVVEGLMTHDDAKARHLPCTMSLPEVLLWQQLPTADVKFRRQHPVGAFVLDFYCGAAKVGVEVDGIAHEMGARPEKDKMRDGWLRQQGFRIVCVPAVQVLRSPSNVAASIVALCRR